MASDSDLEAYLNQLSRKSYSLQKQNIKSDSVSLSNSSATPIFDEDDGDDDDDDDLHSRKVSSKQNFQKKKVETVPGSLLDIKSLSDKYSKRKPEKAQKDTNIYSVEEESLSSYDKERVANGRINKEKINVQEYNRQNAVSKKPKSKVIDDDSSMDEELAKYLNETSLHDEEINKSPQYDIKRHSPSNSSSPGSSFLNLGNMQTLEDILGTRSNDNSESVNVPFDQINSLQNEDFNINKKRGSIQMVTHESSESVLDKDEKRSLLRNLNSTSIFYSKGQSDNSSSSKSQLIPQEKANQRSKHNKEISATESECVSVIEESENIVEESILKSDSSIEEDTKSKNDSDFNNASNSNLYESVSESSGSEQYSYREREFEKEISSSKNESILEKSDTSKERKKISSSKNESISEKSDTSKERKKKIKTVPVRVISKNKLNKASKISISSVEENSGVKIVDQHIASRSKKKTIRKESKASKGKGSESEQRDSSRQHHYSRHKKKKRYVRSSSSSGSDSSDCSNSLSDRELLNISKKLYQKLKHKKHSSYYKRESKRFPEWNYSTYPPSIYGILYPPSFSGIGSNNFGMLNHTAIMRQQVELTRMFMDSQRALYSAYTSVLHSSQHFTTIKDTEKYIKKKRNPTLTFEEALKLVKEERKSSH